MNAFLANETERRIGGRPPVQTLEQKRQAVAKARREYECYRMELADKLQFADEEPNSAQIKQLDDLRHSRWIAEQNVQNADAAHYELARHGAFDDRREDNRSETTRPQWRNAHTGEPIACLRKKDRFADLYRGDSKATDGLNDDDLKHLSVGSYIAGLITGNWDHRQMEFRAAMSTTTEGGHRLVPSYLSAKFFDLARARSVLNEAGATTLDLPGDSLHVARIDADPTITTIAENVEITESEPTITSVQLVPKKLAVLVRLSRELVEDGQNVESVIETTLSRAMGTALDKFGLIGGGAAGASLGTEPAGLINFPSTNSVASIGAIAWEDFTNAFAQVETANYQANAAILHPQIFYDLGDLLENSEANSFAKRPTTLEGVPFLRTTSVTTANAFVGEWQRFLIAVRTPISVEMTTQGHTAFERHQVVLKVVWRGCFSCENGAAFTAMSGITT